MNLNRGLARQAGQGKASTAGRGARTGRQNPKAPSDTIIFVFVSGRIMIVDASECPEWFGMVFVYVLVLVDRNGLKPVET